MKLWEIDNAIDNFAYEIDEETGEILNTDELDNLYMDRNTKLENIGLYIKNLRAESDAIKHEVEVLTVRLKRNNKKAESLLAYMARSLNGEKFSTPRMAVTWRKSESVEIEDEGLVSKDYLIKEERYKPDKAKIKKALKEGMIVDGARLVVKNNCKVQ